MVAATSTKKKTPAKKTAPVKFVPPTVEEGTWQDTIVKSGILAERAEKGSKKAGELLWEGAQAAIGDWLDDADNDASAEGLYGTLLSLLGKHRKGDASKIKTVAVAVKDHGLTLALQGGLSKAYAEAKRLTDVAPAQIKEDEAAEALTSAIAESAPKSTSSLEGAAQKVIGAGVDEASRVIVAAIIDAAGSYDKAEPVLRSLLRAFSQEIAGVKPKPVKVAKAPAKAKGKAVTEATGEVKTKAKAKPAATKAKPAAPVDEADLPDEDIADDTDDLDAEAAIVQDAIDTDLDDLLDEGDSDVPEVDRNEVEVPVKKKAAPVVRRR